MLNIGIASAISVRTRGSLSFTTSDYSHCSNGRRCFAYSSSTPWRSCCCNSIFPVPLCPKYCSNLHGLKQSSLIQRSSYRRPVSGSFGVDRMCDCDKVCSSGERSVGKRRGGLKSKCFENEGVDEVEAILSLLTDDLGEECSLAKEETRRLVREKRENGNVCRECGSKKNRVDVGRRRKERIRSEENEQAILREERGGRGEREKLERELMSKENWKLTSRAEEEEHRQMMRNDRSRTEEKEELLRREEEWLTQGNHHEGSSTGLKSYSTDNELVCRDSKEDDQRREDHREDHASRLANRSSFTGSGVVECQFRKKSEKRLDISVEEMDPRKEALLKDSKSEMTGVVFVEDGNKNKPEIPVRPPRVLEERDSVNLGSTSVEFDITTTSGIAIDDAGKGSLQLGSNTLHGSHIEGSVAIHPEAYAGAKTEFLEQVRSEILHGESAKDPQSNEHDLVCDNQQSGTKGPADEVQNVNEPPIKDSSEAEVQNSTRKDSDVTVKRTGRSLWNIIADIARLRWLHSESHDSGTKTSRRSSANQSMSNEKRFSGYESEEKEEIEERSSKKGSSARHQEGTGSQIKESPSSSTLERSLRHGGEVSGDTSLTITDSIDLPALRTQRSPPARGVPEAGEASASGGGMHEQVKTGLVEQTESVVRDRFGAWEEAYRLEAEQRRVDEIFMREALSEAQKAADNWEVPVGAVLVQNGKIIARGCNLVEELRDSTAHAEIICIREASNKLRSWRLSETTLYVTLEPCPMCAGAILQARIDTLVWGAPNKLLGADGSWIRLFRGDGGNDTEVIDKPAPPVHPFHPNMSIRRGVLAPECADAMQHFFKRRRKKDKKAADTSSKSPSCLPISNRHSTLMAKMHDAFTLTFCL